eukprot:6176303-Pleurochrysis_carterae.AAC.2
MIQSHSSDALTFRVLRAHLLSSLSCIDLRSFCMERTSRVPRSCTRCTSRRFLASAIMRLRAPCLSLRSTAAGGTWRLRDAMARSRRDWRATTARDCA